jgi:DNA sulfur modification protein DndB
MEAEYVFPAVKGCQAGTDFYVIQCPLKRVFKLFLFNEEELGAELRSQRRLNRSQIPEIARYLLKHKKDYVLSALTGCVDRDVQFVAVEAGARESQVGLLHVPMNARFLLNDGQHRRAAIEMALKEDPDIGDDTIAVVLFVDSGFKRSQQMFSTLSLHAARRGGTVDFFLWAHEDLSSLAKIVAERSLAFRDVVELEKSKLSPRSRKLFTLSAIHAASAALLQGFEGKPREERVNIAISFWDEVSKHIPEWQLIRQKKMTSGDVRRDFIHAHGIVLQALGNVGNALLKDYPDSWKDRLIPLGKIDWSRSNAMLWEGRALMGGKLSNTTRNVALTANLIKTLLNIPLTSEEQRIEAAYLQGKNAS